MLGHKVAQCGTDFSQIVRDGGLRVDLYTINDAFAVFGSEEFNNLIANGLFPEVAEVVCRVGRDEQYTSSSSGLVQGNGRGGDGFADAAFATEEEHFALTGKF